MVIFPNEHIDMHRTHVCITLTGVCLRCRGDRSHEDSVAALVVTPEGMVLDKCQGSVRLTIGYCFAMILPFVLTSEHCTAIKTESALISD